MDELKSGKVDNHEYKIIQRVGPTYPHETQTYAWQEFAGYAIEFGGYGDITLINPCTQKALWIHDIPDNTPAILRLIADIAERVGFFKQEE